MTAVLIQPQRRIEPSINTPNSVNMDGQSTRGSPVLIEATLRETHVKRAQITAHPVEQGLDVTDFIRTGPVGIEVEAAFSNQPFENRNTNDGIFAGDNPSRVSAAWDAFLNMIDGRPRREIYSVVTGLRVYDNMALESVGTSQGRDNPESIIIRARFVEVRIVQSTTVSVPVTSLETGEAQQMGQDDTFQGEQTAIDQPICTACEDLCQECVVDVPFSDPPEYQIDEGCAEDTNDLFDDALSPTNAENEALRRALCPSIDATQIMDAGTIPRVNGTQGIDSIALIQP